MKQVFDESCIKGYHRFKIRPHKEIVMDVKIEIGNKLDHNAMIVKLPLLEDITPTLHKEITKEERGKEKEHQTVESTAGKVVGRVPANLCKLFKGFCEKKIIIKCQATGDPTTSIHPPSKQSFKKYKHGKDREGGGDVVPCKYIYISRGKLVRQYVGKHNLNLLLCLCFSVHFITC